MKYLKKRCTFRLNRRILIKCGKTVQRGQIATIPISSPHSSDGATQAGNMPVRVISIMLNRAE